MDLLPSTLRLESNQHRQVEDLDVLNLVLTIWSEAVHQKTRRVNK